jgi:pimeloyl-ACP methyl ester carboxylesterase
MRKFDCQGAVHTGAVHTGAVQTGAVHTGAEHPSRWALNLSACFFLTLALCGCAGPVKRVEALARRGGLEFLVLPGVGFQHRAFAALRGDDLLVVFIDGDGSPWVDHGRRVASDPTPRAPLALELAIRTSESVLYVGRPCYLGLMRDGCSEEVWTSERYSAAVVASMVAATTTYVAAHNFQRVLIVGYSGGGALAVLMASHWSNPLNVAASGSPSTPVARDMPPVAGVVTIAGNLDPDAWTRLHDYLPLTGSLNPAVAPALPTSLREWHLVGDRDANVPSSAAQLYLQRLSPDRIWRYASFDHACCWVREWPAAFARIRAELDEAKVNR